MLLKVVSLVLVSLLVVAPKKVSRQDRGKPVSKKPMHQKPRPSHKPCNRCPRDYDSWDSRSCGDSRSDSHHCTPSCSYSESCPKTHREDSYKACVSWEESEVKAEIVRKRIKNPRHRIYYCPSSSCSSSSSSCEPSSTTVYKTVEVIRPHVARHHRRKIHVKEEVCSLSTEIEVIRKCHKDYGCHRKRYEVINNCKDKKSPKKCEHNKCPEKCEHKRCHKQCEHKCPKKCERKEKKCGKPAKECKDKHCKQHGKKNKTRSKMQMPCKKHDKKNCTRCRN